MAKQTIQMHGRAIEKLIYDDDTEDCIVVFVGRRGAVYYLYPDVGRDLIRDWQKAPSHGQYFHKYIKHLSSHEVFF